MEYVSLGRSGLMVSRMALGLGLRDQRDDVVITSKVNQPVGSGPNDWGASRYHIMREVERSLARLATDRLDVYLLHVYDAATPVDEQVRALDDLVRQGKVRYVGVRLTETDIAELNRVSDGMSRVGW